MPAREERTALLLDDDWGDEGAADDENADGVELEMHALARVHAPSRTFGHEPPKTAFLSI